MDGYFKIVGGIILANGNFLNNWIELDFYKSFALKIQKFSKLSTVTE